MRNADGVIRFTRPDGRDIDANPQLPACGGSDSFRGSISGKGGPPPISASDWVVPEDVMDRELALSGLLQLDQAKGSLAERPT